MREDEAREGARLHPLADDFAVGIRQDGAVISEGNALTESWLAAVASGAPATGAGRRHDDVVTGREAVGTRPDLGYDTSSLMTVDRRERATPGAVDEGDVAVADAARRDTDDYLFRARSAQPHFL
jgi:hypothetical protein